MKSRADAPYTVQAETHLATRPAVPIVGNTRNDRGGGEDSSLGRSELSKIREYILSNPARWKLDRENP